MSTATVVNPFISPASQPQPSIANQFPQSGVDVMPNTFTGPQRALAGYRNGTARGGNLAKPMAVGGSQDSGAIASGPQSMPADGGGDPRAALASYLSGGGMPPRAGGAGRVRPPSVMRPTNARY